MRGNELETGTLTVFPTLPPLDPHREGTARAGQSPHEQAVLVDGSERLVVHPHRGPEMAAPLPARQHLLGDSVDIGSDLLLGSPNDTTGRLLLLLDRRELGDVIC